MARLMHIMTARGWRPVQYLRNDIGQPTHLVPCTGDDIREGRVTNYTWHSQLDGSPAGWYENRAGERPRLGRPKEEMDLLVEQHVKALRDFIDGKISYQECQVRYHSMKVVPEWRRT